MQESPLIIAPHTTQKLYRILSAAAPPEEGDWTDLVGTQRDLRVGMVDVCDLAEEEAPDVDDYDKITTHLRPEEVTIAPLLNGRYRLPKGHINASNTNFNAPKKFREKHAGKSLFLRANPVTRRPATSAGSGCLASLYAHLRPLAPSTVYHLTL